MLLANLEIVGKGITTDILIKGDRIKTVGDRPDIGTDDFIVAFDNAIAFPGLVNSHDHLDFNLFPALGNRKYNNYVEWGNDIHTFNKDEINKILQIPKTLRVAWGIYKNLVNGVTTVVEHGTPLKVKRSAVAVFQHYRFLHSIQLERKWRVLLNKPYLKKWPFVIHIGEGTDAASHNEIDELIKWNLHRRSIIGVHGIAMSEAQASFFKAIVWCPVANYFLIGKTAEIDKLKKHTDILFGTDSTLSAGWNMWEHIKTARETHMLNDEELYNTLTVTPAKIWNLNGNGVIADGANADVVVAKRKQGTAGLDAFYETSPKDILLVVQKGEIRLFDASLLAQLSKFIDVPDYGMLEVNGVCKYAYGNVSQLQDSIRTYYKDANLSFTS